MVSEVRGLGKPSWSSLCTTSSATGCESWAQKTDLIIMDFAKAFDKVSHRRLCYTFRTMLGSLTLTLTSDLVSRMGVESVNISCIFLR